MVVIEKDCSTVNDFVSEYTRLCNNVESCIACPLNRTGVCEIPDFEAGVRNGTYKTLMEYVAPIVQDWYDANPKYNKTWAEDYFEKYPNALRRSNGLPQACRKNCDKNIICEVYEDCEKCWNTLKDA